MAPYNGAVNASIANKLRMGKGLKLLGNTEACIDEVVNETDTFISSSYGFEKRIAIDSWYQKTSKATQSAPLLQTLTPTHKVFRENVKQAHF